MRGESDETETLSRLERFKRFWARLRRAEFQSLTRVEIEMEDKRNPARRFVSVLELKGLEWRLTGLRVTATAPPSQPAGEIDPGTTTASRLR